MIAWFLVGGLGGLLLGGILGAVLALVIFQPPAPLGFSANLNVLRDDFGRIVQLNRAG